ncbi:MAG: LptF/LptG family permease [Phycisphaerales bacterium]
MSRLPLTLWRSMLADLWRLLTLSAAVLVVVIAFAATVKPLSEGRLEPADALKFMAYALVPMLAYALPFAAGFGATLVYHRMASDNELTAAHAGGMSHRRLLAPAVMTSVVLSLAVLVMHDQMMPRFLRRMQQMITVDVSRLIASEVARGNAVQQKNLIIYADSGRSFGPDPASGALDRVVLGRFAAVELDRDGNPTTEASSELATMWLFPGDESATGDEPSAGAAISRVVMRLQNVVALKQGEWTTGSKDTVLRWSVPDMFRDSPAFLPLKELRALEAEPAKMSGINFPRRDLAILMAERDARAELSRLAAGGEFELRDSRGGRVRVLAGGFAWDDRGLRMTPKPGAAEVEAFVTRGVDQQSGVEMVVSSPDAYLITDMGGDRYTRGLELRLEFLRARTREPSNPTMPAEGSQRGDILLSSLSMPKRADGAEFLAPYLAMPTREVLTQADARTNDAPVAQAAIELRRKIRNLERGVLAKIHERLALSATCGLAILVGALAAVRMSRRSPLMIYLWSFLPAMAAIVTIQGGTQVVKSASEGGLVLLWSSVAGLAVYAAVLFRSIARH